MSQISKGANVAVSASRLRADLRWSAGAGVPSVDVSALLLGADGKVSDDDDFVFYNQPEHPSGSVNHAGKTTGAQFCDSVDIELARVPGAVDRIVLAASAEEGTFGQVPGLELAIIDSDSSAEVAVFAMTAEAETAFVCGEVYRRDGAWKFRAIGQGYSSGLAGLATDFGISVEAPEDSPTGAGPDSSEAAEPTAVQAPPAELPPVEPIAPDAPPVDPNWPFPTPPPPGLAPPGLVPPSVSAPPTPEPQYTPPPPPPPLQAPPPPTPFGGWPAPNPRPEN
jgi:stress response protein SCP2